MAAKLGYGDFNDRGRGLHIHNEAAYDAATRKAIKENARKGRGKRWHAEDPTRAALMARIAEAADKGDAFMRAMYTAEKEWGSLSEKQEAAARASFARQDARRAEFKAKDAGSAHVGIVGKRETFTLTVRHVVEMRDDWTQEVYSRIAIMNDEAGNVFVYKGNSLMVQVCDAETGNPDREPGYYTRYAAKGDTLVMVATVKEHGDRDGVAQTVIARPKLKGLV